MSVKVIRFVNYIPDQVDEHGYEFDVLTVILNQLQWEVINISYTGKILRLDLTNRTSSIIDTEPYQQWGGFGISQAVFWDECEDVTVGGFDPKNVLVIATNLTGTLAPSVGNKIEMTGSRFTHILRNIILVPIAGNLSALC